MGCCTGRCFLITLCVLQLVSTIERQVFDFLGYMWAPIIGNFLQIIFVIIGLFGAYQYRPKVVIVYCVWALVWLAWNVFVICFYLEVGILTRDSPILNIGTGNKSWWLNNGIGCVVNGGQNLSESTSQASSSMSRVVPREEDVEGCLLYYYYVEIIHAGVQCILALLGFCVACFVIYVFTEEDDSSQPVHDELEYIKMRYRSPARSSFRTGAPAGGGTGDQRGGYDTLTTQTSTYSGGGDLNPLYEDETAERQHRQRGTGGGSGKSGYQPDLPWTQSGTQQSHHTNQQTDDYGFNTSSQLLYGSNPGQTII